MSKVLSVMQPWATILFHGKNIENRTWYTKYRGELLIHASAKSAGGMSELLNNEQLESLGLTRHLGKIVPLSSNTFWPVGLMTEKFITSAIIGKVDVVDCVVQHPSIWAEVDLFRPIYNWVLENPVLFDEPILNVKGKLNLWNYEI